jgi:hypothetical protein
MAFTNVTGKVANSGFNLARKALTADKYASCLSVQAGSLPTFKPASKKRFSWLSME